MKPYRTGHNDEGFDRLFGLTKAVTGSPDTLVCALCGLKLWPCDGVNHWKQGNCPKCKDQPLEGWWHECCSRDKHDNLR